jgi:hypothetical protein
MIMKTKKEQHIVNKKLETILYTTSYILFQIISV